MGLSQQKVAPPRGVITRDGNVQGWTTAVCMGFTALTDRVFEHAQTIQSLLGVR